MSDVSLLRAHRREIAKRNITSHQAKERKQKELDDFLRAAAKYDPNPQPNTAIPPIYSDQHANCRYWADIGECEKNPNWMPQNCPESCNAKKQKESSDDSLGGGKNSKKYSKKYSRKSKNTSRKSKKGKLPRKKNISRKRKQVGGESKIETLDSEIAELKDNIQQLKDKCKDCHNPNISAQLASLTDKKISDNAENNAINFIENNFENIKEKNEGFGDKKETYTSWLSQYSREEVTDERSFKPNAPMILNWNNAIYRLIRSKHNSISHEDINYLRDIIMYPQEIPADIYYILQSDITNSDDLEKLLKSGGKKCNKKSKKINRSTHDGGFFGLKRFFTKKNVSKTNESKTDDCQHCTAEIILNDIEKLDTLKKKLNEKEECKEEYHSRLNKFLNELEKDIKCFNSADR